MKIFTLYYDRFIENTTSKALYDGGFEHFVLCHSDSSKFIGIHGNIIETGEPKGIQNNLNYGLGLLSMGEWAIFMSDDYTRSRVLDETRGQFVDCDISYTINELIKHTEIASRCNVNLIGLSSTGNPFYSKSKYSKYGLVDGRCFAIRKTEFRFHREVSTIPDYYATAYHLKKYGGNLILNKTFCDFKRYTPKGLGSDADRLKEKMIDISILKKLFPKNIVVKEKKGKASGSHVMVKR